MNFSPLSVTQINNYIKVLFSSDDLLKKIYVKGEISNFKHHYSGHMYFTLKDDNSKIKCVMFKSAGYHLKFTPEDGMNVIVKGEVSIYERDGQYQLYVESISPDGIGALYIAFEQLKKKLQENGYFDDYRKKRIPKFPSKIGVVTSSTGAAIKDILNIIKRRYPLASILIVPVLVQGEGAAIEISNAIKLLNKNKNVDVIITGRGGGSIEELWAFNEECVADAIYESQIPVISAVGHETDFTIADYVADLRAPTPSAAAELCVPDKIELIYKLNMYNRALNNYILNTVNYKKNVIKKSQTILNTLNPIVSINHKKQYLDSLYINIVAFMKHKIEISKGKITKTAAELNALSPLSVIYRGYALVMDEGKNSIISDIENVKKNDNIKILIKNGTLDCFVNEKEEGEFKLGK